ncbi:hypothetical protein EZV62_011670 [Acer yangbiense]|uniref:GAGA-binding transcriptional activator n=1 Tax=Acer yangbiense TaxID=1000413 RepID=A0A5C7I8A9_9ROSI|nr:hypothetical protein EZV62_011670 [Acer yangbiense]
MDDDGQNENGRYKMEYYKGAHAPWNMMPQHQMKEPNNALVMNKKLMSILAERDAAIRERNIAISEKREALAVRDQALEERDKALAERDDALMARDNALAALHYRESAINFPMGGGVQRGAKRMHQPTYHPSDVVEDFNSGDMHITDAHPISIISCETSKSHQAKRTKENKAVMSKPSASPRKVKKVGEDLNKKVASEGKKLRSDWDSLDVGLNLVNFDEATMPVPICSCTGSPRQCYKWGNGGWQSSCCTTTLSSYPLPQMPNKRHARVGGRKMSGSVFTKLLSRLAAEGHDLSLALDLKNYWARHGTNRYITIK